MKYGNSILLVAFLLVGCGSGSGSGSSSSHNESNHIDESTTLSDNPLVGNWSKECSPVDDSMVLEIIQDAQRELWWVESLSIETSSAKIVRNLYEDENCETPFGNLATYISETRSELKSQNDFDLVSFEVTKQETSLPIEPAINVYLSDDRLYKAYYQTNFEPDTLVIDFNVFYQKQ